MADVGIWSVAAGGSQCCRRSGPRPPFARGLLPPRRATTQLLASSPSATKEMRTTQFPHTPPFTAGEEQYEDPLQIFNLIHPLGACCAAAVPAPRGWPASTSPRQRLPSAAELSATSGALYPHPPACTWCELGPALPAELLPAHRPEGAPETRPVHLPQAAAPMAQSTRRGCMRRGSWWL